jgi:alanine-synthesizing transaminase
LIPKPDYPLWTACVTFAGGKAVHYQCDEASDWCPDLEDIERKITSRTKGIVVINPNNPTGAVYPAEVLLKMVSLAEKYGLVVFSDEIYDKILYDGITHHATAAFSNNVLCLTFNGLSKNYRAAGFRGGWVVISGKKSDAKSYIEGLNVLANMRLCSNVPSQFAIQSALTGKDGNQKLVLPNGRLRRQCDLCYEKLTAIPGITCVKPKGAFYMFPRIDVQKYQIHHDKQFVMDFLCEQRVLLVQGSGFNWDKPDHFRLVYLPAEVELAETIDKLSKFLETYKGSFGNLVE